jgi:hypothetical protein
MLLLGTQTEIAFAKKQKHVKAKPVTITVVKSDPLPTGSMSKIPASVFALTSDTGCNAGKLRVDFNAKSFNFAAYLESQKSTASDAIP